MQMFKGTLLKLSFLFNITTFLLLFVICGQLNAQIVKILTIPPSSQQTDSFRNLYGHNKVFFDDIEKAALVALSYFPDLKDVSIEFRIRKIKTTMAARPKYSDLLKSKEKRKYLICMNNRANCMGLVFFDKLTFDAQVGVIAHELCHVYDYTQLSLLGITRFGFNYLTVYGRRKTENRTDEAVIKHGLGKALSKYCYYLEHDDCLPAKYIAYKKKYYYSYSDIERLTSEWESSHLQN